MYSLIIKNNFLKNARTFISQNIKLIFLRTSLSLLALYSLALKLKLKYGRVTKKRPNLAKFKSYFTYKIGLKLPKVEISSLQVVIKIAKTAKRTELISRQKNVLSWLSSYWHQLQFAQNKLSFVAKSLKCLRERCMLSKN